MSESHLRTVACASNKTLGNKRSPPQNAEGEEYRGKGAPTSKTGEGRHCVESPEKHAAGTACEMILYPTWK